MKKCLVAIVACLLSLICGAQSDVSKKLLKYAVEYYCTPCGCSEDGKQFDVPGVCQACNMTYMSRVKGLEGKPQANTSRRKVAILLYDGADIMDVTGPLSVFEHAGFTVFKVAKNKNPKRIGMYTLLEPDYTFEEMPEVDILVVPGGGPAESNQDKDIVNWLRAKSDEASTLFSVCSGAFFLGRAGILDGKEATTFASLIPDLEKQFPRARVLDDVKYTNDGNVVTSSGLSSGMDATFEVVAKYYGIGAAQDIANRMEYSWKRKNDYARTQLADNYILSLGALIRRFATKYYHSEGNMKFWEYRFILWNQVESHDFLALIRQEMDKIDGFEIIDSTEQSVKGIYHHHNLGTGEIRLSLSDTQDGLQASLIAERIDQKVKVKS